MSSMFAILAQIQLRWLWNVCRMEDGRIPKVWRADITGKWQTGWPTLRCKDVSARRTSRHAASTQQSLRQRLCIKPDGNQRSGMALNCWRSQEREPVGRLKRIRKWQRLQSSSAAATIPTTGYICGKYHHICIHTAATVAVHLLSQVQMPLSLETEGCQQQIVDVWYQIKEISFELQIETKKKHFVFCYPYSSNEISLIIMIAYPQSMCSSLTHIMTCSQLTWYNSSGSTPHWHPRGQGLIPFQAFLSLTAY